MECLECARIARFGNSNQTCNTCNTDNTDNTGNTGNAGNAGNTNNINNINNINNKEDINMNPNLNPNPNENPINKEAAIDLACTLATMFLESDENYKIQHLIRSKMEPLVINLPDGKIVKAYGFLGIVSDAVIEDEDGDVIDTCEGSEMAVYVDEHLSVHHLMLMSARLEDAVTKAMRKQI